MNIKFLSKLALILLVFSVGFTSCTKEEDPVMKQATYSYSFNTGQLDASYAYSGSHANTLSAKITIDEMAGNTSKVTVDIMNAVDGEVYPIHAHDATGDSTVYNPTPNAAILAGSATASGTTASYSQNSTMSYEALTTTYSGFFVIHDPMQTVNPADPTTFVVLGSFAN